MKIAGIIAEYNPFHNGHRYHIEQLRSKTGADYIIAVLSGDFTQRGVPALLSKHLRAEMALQNGVDLVLELPCAYAAASAEAFASGGVQLLNALGCVDYLGFGCECGELKPLFLSASLLKEEPPLFRQLLQENLKQGLSYPTARSNALASCLTASAVSSGLLSSPNNILGIEYLKALLILDSSIQPIAIPRSGSGYHETALSSRFSSALAIRTHLLETGNPENLLGQVPDSVLSILRREYQKTYPVCTHDFSSVLYYKLILEAETGYEEYADVSKDLSAKIKKNLHSFTDFDSFCMRLKSKDITYTRICRCLIHILLNIKHDALQSPRSDYPAFYGRILGFRKNSTPLLGILKENAKLPLLARASDAKAFTTDPSGSVQSKSMLSLDLRASRIYRSVLEQKFHTSLPDEFGSPLLKL